MSDPEDRPSQLGDAGPSVSVPRGTPDLLVLALAALVREVHAKRTEDRAQRRATMTVVHGACLRNVAERRASAAVERRASTATVDSVDRRPSP